MSVKYNYSRWLVAAGLLFIVNSCTRDNEEELAVVVPVCDTLNISFASDVLPIIAANCYSCHGNGITEGGMNLDGYNRIKRQADNNALLNVIQHNPGYAQMPKGRPKLSSCDISKIDIWIKRGAPNN